MSGRRERVLAFLASQEGQSFDGSVNDLAADMEDPSPGALSATVSVLVKEGVVGREPDGQGVVATRLWLRSMHDALDGERPPSPEPGSVAALLDDYRQDAEATPEERIVASDVRGYTVDVTPGAVGGLVEVPSEPEPEAATEVPHCAGTSAAPHERTPMVRTADGWLCMGWACGLSEPEPEHVLLPHPGERGGSSLDSYVVREGAKRAALAPVGRLTAEVVVELCNNAGALSLRIDTPWPLPEDEANLVDGLLAAVGDYYADRARMEGR